MDVFRVTVTDIFGGETILTPSSLRLRRGISSPAEGMTGSFPVERRPAELIRLRVLRNDSLIFEGKIDEQRLTFSENGMILRLDARSKGALLIDNEAMPETLYNHSTHNIFERLIAPHGFLLLAASKILPEFTVRKGLTLWDAFSVFARRTYGRLPFVSGDMVHVSQTNPGESAIIGGRDIPFSRLEHTIRHYTPISRIFIRDDEGNYHTSVSNPDAPIRQIHRERYLIPAGEFVEIPRWDAGSRIQRSMRQMETVVAELPGFWEMRTGRGVTVNHPSIHIPNLLVDESVFTLDHNGARTSLTLARMQFD